MGVWCSELITNLLLISKCTAESYVSWFSFWHVETLEQNGRLFLQLHERNSHLQQVPAQKNPPDAFHRLLKLDRKFGRIRKSATKIKPGKTSTNKFGDFIQYKEAFCETKCGWNLPWDVSSSERANITFEPRRDRVRLRIHAHADA